MNSVVITGNLGRDPESRATPGGKVVVSASLAVSQGKDKPAMWLDISAWEDGHTTFAANNLAGARKGDKVVLSGRLSLREWTDSEGARRQSWGITAQDIEVCKRVERPAEQREQRRPPTTARSADAWPENTLRYSADAAHSAAHANVDRPGADDNDNDSDIPF